MNILYIGSNDSEWAQFHRPVSLAGAKWARGFLTALSKRCRLIALTHTYEVAWPRGRVFWRGYDARLYPAEWECESVSYPVLRHVREVWWRFAYAAKAKRIVREKQIDVVLVYNCNLPYLVAVMSAIKKVAPTVRIYSIVLDGDDPRKDNWGWLKKAAVYSDGFIPLSWWVHQHIATHTGRPSYHMDGGADRWCGVEVEARENAEHQVKTLVHTGALDQWRGLNFMIEVVRQLTAKRADVKFIFCGKSSEAKLKQVFGGNPQVELPGFVSEIEMARICNAADVLLNVRDPEHPDNILNYPSKLPQYLSFGRPIVSTRLLSLSPDYEAVVHFPADDTVGAYVKTVEDVLQWDSVRRAREYDAIRTWFAAHKTWEGLVGGLVAWLEG